MTPLLGTKNPSAPVGDKSGGDTRAARSLLSCALWRGMGRLWRGMGGMGRPEPLSAHRPHQQQGLSGFHETRDPRPGYCQAHGKCQREFRGFHETRITRHESRPLCFSRDTKHETRLLSPSGRCFPARCGAIVAPLWRGYGAAVAMARHGRPWSGMGGILPPRQCPRSRQPFSVGLTTGLHFSPRGEAKCVTGPSDISSGANQAPSHGFHESRDTKHESRPFFACFDRRVVRHAG